MNKCVHLGFLMLVSASVMAQTAPAARQKVEPKASRKEIRVVARNIAAEVRAPLTAAELEIAQRVHVGSSPCELGQTVVLMAEPALAGYFSLRIGKESYRVAPQETTTGAIRLEDKVAGVVWLQLANKSMLMSQKLGKRLADECKSPTQLIVAEAMAKDPPMSILDAVQPITVAGPAGALWPD